MRLIKCLRAWLCIALPAVRVLPLPANELPRSWVPKTCTLPIEQRGAP